MALLTIRPTDADKAIANAISEHTKPLPEKFARLVTWGADEKLLLALAAAGWICSRGKAPALRRAGNHALVVTVAASALPHVFKHIFDQTRPDRLTVRGHWRGVSFSGKREDAFPSGHALHMGALASAAAALPQRQRHAAWALAAGLSLSRVVLLAHWTTDVIAGFAIGALIERVLRKITQYPRGLTLEKPAGRR
jgi:membrane-associated phospholipid phosphatase